MHICTLLDLKKGCEVLVPAYNVGAELDPLIKNGIQVSLYRIDRSGVADIPDIISRITSKTRAIYATHYFGFPQKVDDIKLICDQYNLYLIEDCALSLFSKHGEKKIGSVGDVSIFSLTKTLPLPDGGVLIINNEKLKKVTWNLHPPEKRRVLRKLLPLIKSSVMRRASVYKSTNPLSTYFLKMDAKRRISKIYNDLSASTNKPTMAPDQYYYEFLTNRHISAVSDFLLGAFDIDNIITKRRRNFSLLQSLLINCGAESLFKNLPEGVCPLHFPVIVKNRDHIQRELYKRNIYTGAWWKGYYEDLDWNDYPEACYLKDNVLTLPVHHDLDDKNIESIAENLIELIG
jgi:dTDP-4-amino-4,6-dideoxygalactose transaminase